MSNVSASSIASLAGSVPRRPIPPRLYGLLSGTTALPSSALTTGAASRSQIASTSSGALRAPCPTNMTTLFPTFRISAAFFKDS